MNNQKIAELVADRLLGHFTVYEKDVLKWELEKYNHPFYQQTSPQNNIILVIKNKYLFGRLNVGDTFKWLYQEMEIICFLDFINFNSSMEIELRGRVLETRELK